MTRLSLPYLVSVLVVGAVIGWLWERIEHRRRTSAHERALKAANTINRAPRAPWRRP